MWIFLDFYWNVVRICEFQYYLSLKFVHTCRISVTYQLTFSVIKNDLSCQQEQLFIVCQIGERQQQLQQGILGWIKIIRNEKFNGDIPSLPYSTVVLLGRASYRLSSRSSTQLPCLFRDKSGRREEWAGSFPLPLGFLYPTTTPSVEISNEGPNFQSSFSKNTRFSFFRQQEYPLFVHDKGKI